MSPTPPRQPAATRESALRNRLSGGGDPEPERGGPRGPRDRDSTDRLPGGRPSYKGRATTVYFPDEDERERFKNAARLYGGPEGIDGLSDLLYRAALEKVQRWERAAERNLSH